jgi:signal transduction histidine kinase/ActR/RegA family two-component response regulator
VALADARRVLVHGHRDPSIYEFIGKDGTKKLGEVNGSPLIQDNEITGVVSVARDVTERVAMERQLHQQARLAAVGQLAAGIAHDFRNLLTTIILYAEMALRQPEISQGLADKLKVIIGESHKATDLVQQILDFSIRGTISTRPLDLADRVGEVAAILRRTLPESIRFAIHTEPDPIVVRADPGRLQQVLTNLALNARDAMPEGGTLTFDITTLTVRDGGIPPVAKMKPGPWACLAVQDTGKGMTEEVQAHLFEPFFTTKEAGEGTGLGLAQVYGIIRQHEGAIDIDSAVGEGTTVRVYLPLSTDGEPEMAPPSTEAPRGRGETILLVEDQKKLRAAASALLRSLGYVVHTAANGREALAVYQTLREQAQGIDLVVSDVVMPEMSGQALAESLKALDPSIKMLAITGYPLGEVQSQLRSLGFEEVVGKPLDADSFAHAVRRSLSKTPTGAAENRREE